MLGWFKKRKAKKKEVEQSIEEDGSVVEEASLPAEDVVQEEPLQQDQSDSVEEVDTQQTQQEAAPPEESTEESPEEPAEEPAEEPEQAVEQEAKQQPPAKSKSMFKRLTDRLSKTRDSFVYRLDTLFLGKKEIDADLFDDLEEILITADLGVQTTTDILEHARRTVQRKKLSDPAMLKETLKEKLKSYITEATASAELVMPDDGPLVIMMIGVNGVGKTTSIGKIAHKFIQSGQSVMLVAADTFRAAAVAQLKIWGERNNVEVVSQHEGADPSSVVFDALAIAKKKEYDVVLVDTAGRLHTQTNLMEELKKIKRVMKKQLPDAPHEVMLVLDATTGQNGISQAKLFDAAVDITGLTLTKLDGTAKGGIVVNICRELKIPLRFIGIGEQVDDLRDFEPEEFIDALFESKKS